MIITGGLSEPVCLSTLFQLGFATLYIVTAIRIILALLSWNRVKKFRSDYRNGVCTYDGAREGESQGRTKKALKIVKKMAPM